MQCVLAARLNSRVSRRAAAFARTLIAHPAPRDGGPALEWATAVMLLSKYGTIGEVRRFAQQTVPKPPQHTACSRVALSCFLRLGVGGRRLKQLETYLRASDREGEVSRFLNLIQELRATRPMIPYRLKSQLSVTQYHYPSIVVLEIGKCLLLEAAFSNPAL